MALARSLNEERGRRPSPVSGGRPPALAHPRALTNQWLTAMLRGAGVRAEVGGFRWRRIGADTGIGGYVTRIELRYRGPHAADAPPTLVVKFPREPEWVDAAVVERRFYLDHATACPIGTPRCYYATVNRRARRWTLVLEDLARHRPLDDIVGISSEDAEVVVDALAAMHAWSARPGVGLDWLTDPDVAADWLPGYYEQNLERGLRRLRGFLPREHLAAFRGLTSIARASLAPISLHPLVATHNDFRGDNLFMSAGRSPIAVDWENVSRNRGGAELGRFLVTSLRPETLKRDGEALIGRYAVAVTRHGLAGYPRAEIERDVRIGMVRHMLQAVAQMQAANLGRGRPLRVVRTWAIRSNSAVRRFDALSAIPATA